MKKLLTIMIALALTVSLAACGSANDGTPSDTSGDSSLPPVTEPLKPETTARPADPATDAIKTFINTLFADFNAGNYDGYLSYFSYDDEVKAQMKDNYITMASIFGKTEYTLTDLEVLSRTEDDLLMVNVKYESKNTGATGDAVRYAEQSIFQLSEGEAGSYVILNIMPGTSTEIK